MAILDSDLAFSRSAAGEKKWAMAGSPDPHTCEESWPLLYNSYDFIFKFLPAALILFYLAARFAWTRLATASLVVMSLVFYSFRDWHTVFILLASIFFNYSIGYLLRKRQNGFVLFVGIGGNLAALAYFKYADFLIGTMNSISGLNLPLLKVALPLGISFFTFTQIAFLIDTAQGDAGKVGLLQYLQFMAFFPHLISGPIVHYGEVSPQFAQPGSKRWTAENVNTGLLLFSLGLAKKVLLADTCAPWANSVFDGAAPPAASLQAWFGALAYTLQLYFDFSGYTDMAIGSALFFNVRLPENFNSPYKSISVIDFWQRWHMTLSQFLRDYVYTPMAFAFRKPQMRLVSILLTMLLCGLWHGAGWNFVLWGGYHGVLLVLVYWWQSLRRPLPRGVARVITFLAIIAGWVIFRARNVYFAMAILTSMFSFSNTGLKNLSGSYAELLRWAGLAVLLVFINVAPTSREWIESRKIRGWHAVVAGALFFACLLVMRTTFQAGGQTKFIYFQF
jgi:alginate O-acetyltransferase complex protein AlgI